MFNLVQFSLAAAIITALVINISPKLIAYNDGSGKLYEGTHIRIGKTPGDTQYHDYVCDETRDIEGCSASVDSCEHVQNTAMAALCLPIVYIIFMWLVVAIQQWRTPDAETNTPSKWATYLAAIVIVAETILLVVPIGMLTNVTTQDKCNQEIQPALGAAWGLWVVTLVITTLACINIYKKSTRGAFADYSIQLLVQG